MRTHQYVAQEKRIASADTNGIRERWLWGLRILRDPDCMADSGLSLRHGVTMLLIVKAAVAGIKLGEQEIQRRIRCARTYKTEAQIREVLTDFRTWDDLARAGFPAYETDEDEPPADHRTEVERVRDHKAAEEEAYGSQPVIDGMEMFAKLDPATATVKDAFDECDKSEDMTANFANYDRKRRSFANRLLAAAGGDESMTIADADALLHAETP